MSVPFEKMPEHSPLGASGAYRWMKCPGSVMLARGTSDNESEFAALGTAAHALGELCLSSGEDAWQSIGQMEYGDFAVDADMANAVQVYLDAIQKTHGEWNQGNGWIEREFYCPDIHEYFYGRSDFTGIVGSTLHVWDYKHGAGVVVDVIENPQGMYYAVGMIEDLQLWDTIDTVVIHIVQPRGWHQDGAHRYWTIPTSSLRQWLDDTLVPAMNHAMASRDTASGEHCRFCPVRAYACPQILADFDELEELMNALADKGGADELSDTQLGRLLSLHDTAKIAAKAAETTAFNRLQAGKKVPGRKLVNGRANRTWKDSAEKAIATQFGDDAFERKMMSPAQIDKLPGGEKLTAEHAFKPEGKLTVASSEDKRMEVSRDTKSMFKDETKAKKGKRK